MQGVPGQAGRVQEACRPPAPTPGKSGRGGEADEGEGGGFEGEGGGAEEEGGGAGGEGSAGKSGLFVFLFYWCAG